ncbi:MAG TPA: outer membrane lipoprotein carrier protein LolA [Flavipsychrobacter sp.]|nr:outer membrane lipoprotein carrier protein LolA [Flavipsychrobacter sp.]
MNKIIVTAVFSLFPLVAWAQPKGYTSVKNTTTFETELSNANAGIRTINSDFSQTKNMALLAEKVKSKGKFYFMKEDKIRIEYTQPFSYILVMNKGQVLVKDEQKTSKVNTKNSKALQSVNRIMIDCMRGTILSNPDFKASVFESGNSYLIALIPSQAAMKNMFSGIDIYLTKKQFDVTRLVMKENGGDLTDMNFSNAQHNQPLNETLFKVK